MNTISTIILAILGCYLIKDLLFWLYVLQLKEYRRDKLKDFFITAHGYQQLLSKKNALRGAMILLLISITLLKNSNPIRTLLEWFIVFNILCIMTFIDIVPLFVSLKRKTIKQPDWTKRILMVSGASVGILGLLLAGWYYRYGGISIDRSQYSSIASSLSQNIICILMLQLLIPLIVAMGHILVIPIAWFEKKRILKAAQRKVASMDNLITIGISGSYGKSSVKMLLSELLSTKYESSNYALTTPGNINTELGISQYLLSRLKQFHRYFICEFGTYTIGESKLIGDIVDQKIGFLTGLNNQHVGLFGSVSNAIQAETELLIKLRQHHGTIYANRDDHLARSVSFHDVRLVRYSITDPSADAYVSDIGGYPGAYKFTLRYKHNDYTFKTDLIGKHNILNLTGVLACCLDQGIAYEILYEHTKRLTQSQKTLHITTITNNSTTLPLGNSITLIDDSYNINQNGVKAGLDLLSEYKGRKIVFIDEIIELGHETEQTHRELGQTLAQYNLDSIYLTGKNYKKYIKAGYEEVKAGTSKIQKPEQSIIKRLLKDSATILFLGRGTQIWLEYFKKNKQ